MKTGYHDLLCLECFLLVFLVIHFSSSFEFRCPSSKQWIIRANSRCLIADGYTCLYNDNINHFTEICRNHSYIYRSGYKLVIVGNLDRRNCEGSRYQPFPFSTNGRSTCIFEKTYCSGEGQMIVSNGSTISDRQCRCDYTQGYDFITKPTHSCYCVPSMEDCSCYQKSCTPGFILSPDYKCINLTRWNSQFTCELILPYRPKDPKFPSHDNNLDESVAAPERNVRIILSISIGVTIFFTLIIAKKHVERTLLSAGKGIPQNIRDLQIYYKKQWKERFSFFVETKASKDIFERIKEEQCVIISGPFGCGKSSIAFHTALTLEETLGFDFMIISNPDDLLRYASKNKRQIILIDDAFESEYNTIWWNRQSESIHHLVKRNTNLRLLITSQLHIYRSVNLQRLKVSFCVFNLISKGIALTFEERQMIGRCYLPADVIDNLSKEVVTLYSFFPMLCGNFNNNSTENILEYFTNPVDYIQTDIEKFQKKDFFYLALAVLIVLDNNVNNELLNEDNNTVNGMLKFLSKEIGYTQKPTKQLLYLCFIAMTDSYISEKESSFVCLHCNLFNALVLCIGPRIIHSIILYGKTAFIIDKLQLKTPTGHYPKLTIIVPNSLQDIYFKRILLDMKTAVHNIFIGSQHLSSDLRELYIAYMKKHLKKEDLRKNSYGNTILHLVSAEGYEDYVEYFLTLDKQMVNEQDNTGQTALHKTCMKGHLNVATLLLDNGRYLYIDQSDNDQKTALDIACDCHLIDMVNLLLSRGATIRQKKTDLRSQLHVACFKGDFKITELLLKYKAAVNEWDHHEYSPLHLACQKGSIEIAEILITHKAIIDIADGQGDTPLFTACKTGHFKIAELLLFHKANPNTRNLIRNTPILIACEKKHKEMIRLLLKYKADANCKNEAHQSPLQIACRSNIIDIILLLIRNDAFVNEPDFNLQTPLFIACSKGYRIVMGKITELTSSLTTASQNDETPLHEDDKRNREIIQVLLNAGANVNQGDSYGITPIHLACKAQRGEIVKLLINTGADVNKADNNGTTPVDMAREGRRKEILKLMLKAKFNVNYSDKHSTQPLHMACREGSEAKVKTLLDAGVNVNEMDTDGMTSLYFACKGGHQLIVTLLINAGVNVNKGDKNGLTPLHMACKEGKEAIVKVFLNSIANINMKDKDGMTPLDLALKHKHTDIASLLLNADANGKRGNENEITTLHIADKGEQVTANEGSIGNVDDDENSEVG